MEPTVEAHHSSHALGDRGRCNVAFIPSFDQCASVSDKTAIRLPWRKVPPIRASLLKPIGEGMERPSVGLHCLEIHVLASRPLARP